MKTFGMWSTAYSFSLSCQQCAYSDWCLYEQLKKLSCLDESKRKKAINLSFTIVLQTRGSNTAQPACCAGPPSPHKAPAAPGITPAHSDPEGGKEV